MSATGIFASAQSTLVASLTGLGLAVVTDSRNARPMTVFVEPPHVHLLQQQHRRNHFRTQDPRSSPRQQRRRGLPDHHSRHRS
jgi:hypothetical protein